MTELMADPFEQFGAWLRDAEATEPNDPTAAVLATATPEGRPSARMLLVKIWDRRGFVVFTNLESRKSAELFANPEAALLFHWKLTRRQIRIEGRVELAGAAEADSYFASRPRQSQIGAWASDQSRPLESRAVFEARVAAAEARFAGTEVPRPPHWTGWRLVPRRFEFWQDVEFRLHDRTIYTRDGEAWERGKLFP
jgi:pyridoxamine 5'-phosphate oxidase